MKISLRNVSKQYKGMCALGKYALKDFTTELTEGGYGLLGANGAGKTTAGVSRGHSTRAVANVMGRTEL